MRKSFRSPFPTSGRQDQSQQSSIEHTDRELNPFYMKTIKKVVASQKSIILRLPYEVTVSLGLNFHNFNPKASQWVDRTFKESFFKLWPKSFMAKP